MALEIQWEEIMTTEKPGIKVLGLGKGGLSAVNHMMAAGMEGVEFITAHTDFQALEKSLAPQKIRLGAKTTGGQGTGGNPEMGSRAVREDRDAIRHAVEGYDMVIITAGLGGGTGTGGAPVVAEICRESGVLTLVVATMPFAFEGKERREKAKKRLDILESAADLLIVIPNDHPLYNRDEKAAGQEMYRRADNILLFAVKGISDLLLHPGFIQVDLEDLKEAMGEKGRAHMGMGMGAGKDRAVQAARQAVSNLASRDIPIGDARWVLLNITAGAPPDMREFEEINALIMQELDDDTDVIIGMASDLDIGEEIRVTVIAVFKAGA